MRAIVTLFAAGALLASPLAFADEEQFNAADTNADAALSAEEVTAAFPDAAEDALTTADTDGDGSLNLEEFNAAVEAGTLSAS